ncbi:uncharacterized protein [Coffea arabica]|uniref:CCHC-type domain-containing protein n=1 Tax=Coffea arabica TaxID=13443 RepID=A0ABM4UF75_COFAR
MASDNVSTPQPSSATVAVALPFAKPFPDVSKIEIFANENFKRWQERVHSLLDIHGVAYALTESQPSATADAKTQEAWQYANKVCRHTILQTLSNELFDVYCSSKEAKAVWEGLVTKFTAEDATKQKFVVGKYNQWQMTDDKEMKIQITEYQMLLEDLKNEDINLPEKFAAGMLIEKLPESWADYKNNLKHKEKNYTMDELVKHILIEDSSKRELRATKAKEMAYKANLVQSNNKRYANKSQNYKPKNFNVKPNNPNFKKKKGNCFYCGKSGHYAVQCRHNKGDRANGNPPKVHLTEGDDIIAAVISQVNIAANVKEWVIDSGATRHICANREAFSSYTPIGDDEEVVYLGDSRTANVLGKGKVFLKLTSGKTLALNDLLHVPNIRANLVSVALLGKVGVKVSFESGKIIMTKNNVFLGKGYCNQGLFVLNISNVINENASSSAYIVDSISLWHARLGHVNIGYIKKMQSCGLISEVDKCVYVKIINDQYVIISLYVDDMLIFGTSLDIVNSTKYFLSSNFDMKDLGEAKIILGVKIIRKCDGIMLSQEHYTERLLRKFENYDVIPVSTPYDANTQLKKNNGDPIAQSKYAQIIGSLMHLMNFTRPDIAYAVCRLSRYTHNPNREHWFALVRLMKYLRGTMNFGILYSGFPTVLEGYSDANWISDSNDTKSTSGYVFTLGGGSIAWKSARQTIIARSTMESEFVALELTGTEAEWLRNFLANIPSTKDLLPPMSIHCDCQAAIAIAKNKSYNCKSRHMKLRHDVVKQLLRDEIISIDFVKSELNLADPLTKPVGRKLILQTTREMGLRPTVVNRDGNPTYVTGDPMK